MKPKALVTKGNGRLAATLGFLVSIFSIGCCFIPVLLIYLGIGSAEASRVSSLDDYRPYFTGLSLLLIGWSVHRYRQRTGKISCDSQSRNGISYLTSPAVFWILVAGSLFILVLPWVSEIFFHHPFLDHDPD